MNPTRQTTRRDFTPVIFFRILRSTFKKVGIYMYTIYGIHGIVTREKIKRTKEDKLSLCSKHVFFKKKNGLRDGVFVVLVSELFVSIIST